MADKPIQDLVAATAVSEEDLFVLQQSNTAKKLTGRTLANWLLELADGHGGINNIQKTGTSGLLDTYTITYADLTTQTFTVTNGREITTINTYYAASSNGTTAPSTWYTTRQTMTPTDRYLWSYQTFIFNGGSPSTYSTPKTVVGVYGDKGETGEQGVSVTGIVQQSVPSGSRYKDYKFSFSDGTYSNTIRIYDGRGISNIAKTDTDDLVDTYTISYNDNTTSEFQVTNGRSVTSITKTGTVGLVDTYTITYNDETTSTFTVTNGKGITSISKTSTSGLVDTYTISYTDGSTPVTFEVTNGASIQSIAKTSTSGLVDTYTVTLTNGNTTTFTVTNAKSITSVTQTGGTHAAGTTDTYTITFNDGDTTTFTVYNGANGTGSVSTVDGIQPGGNQNVTLLLTGNGAPTQDTVGQLYQRYFDLNSQILYICTNVDTSSTPTTYSWAGTGVPVDSALSTSSVNPVQNKIITGKVGTVALNTTAQDLSNAVNELDSAVQDLDESVGGLETAVQGKVSKSGDTMTGSLTISGADILMKSTQITDGSGESGVGKGFRSVDSNDYAVGYIRPRFASGDQSMEIVSRRNISGTNQEASLQIGVDASGNEFVEMSDPSAWREELGISASASNPNLLDNWYFVGGGSQNGYGIFPINQRGNTSYSGTGYTLDRWRGINANGKFEIPQTNDCIKISKTANLSSGSGLFRQPMQKMPAGTYTASVLVKAISGAYRLYFGSITDGTNRASASFSTTGIFKLTGTFAAVSDFAFWIASGDSVSSSFVEIIACKLELGDTQTLAHNEGTDANPVWVLNAIPDYEEQLIQCKTSQADSEDTYANQTAVTVPASNSKAIFGLNGRAFRYTTLTSSDTITISFGGQCAVVLTFSGNAEGRCGMYIVYCNTVSTNPIVQTVAEATLMTITPSAGKVTITTSTSATVTLDIMTLRDEAYDNRITVTKTTQS